MLSRKFRRTVMAALVAPALAVPAAVLAEGNQQQSQQRQSSQQSAAQSPIQLQRDDIRASQLTGMEVKNAQGEDLGEVKDIVIDARSGKVEYVALAHGGILGIGEDLFAYPVSAFSRGADRDELVLNADVTEEQLEDSQGFNDENWPKLRSDEGYWAGIDRRFGADRPGDASTGSSAGQERSFVRASEIADKSVQDRAGNDLGQIEDLVVNLNDGQVRFAVIDTAGDDTLVPVPMDALSVRDDGGEPAVRYERERMDLSGAFDKDQWPEQLRRESGSGS
jgi:sporulation protein YlmC with PRC-barrel domain